MRIGIVGGLDRNELSYERLARDHGHEVECHNGRMRGTASTALEGLVERADLVQHAELMERALRGACLALVHLLHLHRRAAGAAGNP